MITLGLRGGASGACEKYPDFNFLLGESRCTWLPYVFDRLDTESEDRAPRPWQHQDPRRPPQLSNLAVRA
jgi:hypothetical protein